MRRRQWTLVGMVAFLTICAYTIFRIPPDQRPIPTTSSFTNPPPKAQEPLTPPAEHDAVSDGAHEPPSDRQPKPAGGSGSHPMWHLMTEAEKDFQDTLKRQSKTLEDAVAEYRRRYGIPPPPNFDRWYNFAKASGVQLIDEYDTIHEMLTPFWGLKPATIRERAKEALGFDNNLLGLLIRDRKISHIQGGQDWQREATSGMVEKFIQHLPSMDIAFNIHDEPRVIVPHEDLARLVKRAKDVNMPRANAAEKPQNAFTKRARDLSEGNIIEAYKRTRFNVFAHQPTWTHSRMSCPPDSPSRALEDDELSDDRSRYATSELGFVYNVTAMSDICLSPSLSSTYGFFDRPNAFNIVHDLFPIFSQSKISSFNDILYPSPWYWYKRVAYDETKDVAWDEKEDRLYWRGSTTGGFSRNGGWRRQHRQHLVQKINAADQAKIYINRGDETQPRWEVKEVPRGDYRDIIDVYFSHVGQCDPGDCDAQKEFFKVHGRVEQQDAWKYKYLLDMDGNAFSGRFYAFLQSRSLVFKFAIFREWHFEWLRPWAHYIPLSLQGDDWLEAVRFFGDGSLGRGKAERMALDSRDWANKVLRKEDMEVWFFRLLLEYGRVIDDNRDNIGFSV
ncbi:Beta-1,2-xylosyltransferase 1-like protein 4 [Colletotrichum chlorophyti]|uniref:Beta-1,2-xylosyltransferase 1-like protein 4 n=1 Tax=Colletotrichum chlorophyti TaxID=708187 RepID=A0A1Q8RN53_9PEZI|nr:Beta-1,2-xylosyltransferase 1-like protein 4 [Colletotrichum chlorophyti]